MKVENKNSISDAIKKFAKFVSESLAFWFSLAVSILIFFGKSDIIVNIMANQQYHTLFVLALIETGYFSADRTISHLIKDDNRSIPIWLIHLTPLFIWITMAIDVVLFEIDVFNALVEASKQQDLHDKLDFRFTQAQILSYYSTVAVAVFFYGNKIWDWIRKSEARVDEAEKIYLKHLSVN